MTQDSIEYSKFNFLTNGGESFDRSKSFIIPDENSIRFIWDDEKCNFSSGSVDKIACKDVFKEWCSWFNAEKG